MTAPPRPPLHSIRLHSRIALIAAYALVAPFALGVLWFVGASFSETAAVVALSLGALGVLTSLVHLWGQRIDAWPDRLVVHRGFLPRAVPLDAVESLALRPYDPRAPLRANPYLGARIAVRDGAPVTLSNVATADALPLFDLLAATVAERLRTRLAHGETLTFRDEVRFPWAMALGLGVFAVILALVTLGERARGSAGHLGTLVRAAGVLLGFGGLFSAMLRTWRNARRQGGLVVSDRGLRAVNDADRAARNVATPFRDDGTAWIPWASVRAVRLDAQGLVIETAALAEPLVLSSASTDVLPLYTLLTARLAGR